MAIFPLLGSDFFGYIVREEAYLAEAFWSVEMRKPSDAVTVIGHVRSAAEGNVILAADFMDEKVLHLTSIEVLSIVGSPNVGTPKLGH